AARSAEYKKRAGGEQYRDVLATGQKDKRGPRLTGWQPASALLPVYFRLPHRTFSRDRQNAHTVAHYRDSGPSPHDDINGAGAGTWARPRPRRPAARTRPHDVRARGKGDG